MPHERSSKTRSSLLTGVRHGLTLGSPVAIEIANTEWPKWTEVMSADALDHDLRAKAAMRR